ncbi:MAG: hypothetical protein OXI08_06510 [Cyanobacteria bacterium MAG IRC4_bin_6]|nr:hypothetical protein [Cyanobacteria bacterium MAG IRC4_bin_6]
MRRCTGQESREERQRIAREPPDILLTNFMMAELLLTRQDELATKVINQAMGPDFIVLDEFHTYRGRQGADVAILVRRLRNRCTPDKAPICIGTSATMANEGESASRSQAVADVAARLFGTPMGPDGVIGESLQRTTDDGLKLQHVRPKLAEAVRAELSHGLTDEKLRTHPLAVWVELAIGLDDQQELTRKEPVPFDKAAEQLAQDSGQSHEICRERLEQFLTMVSLPETERGGTGSGAFLAFKLHRFVSGAGDVYTTLTESPRRVLFDGQLEDPETPGHRLYPTRFCRACGHEAHVVTRATRSGEEIFLPRNIDDTPIEDQDQDNVAGYLTPTRQKGDTDYRFTGELDTFPEDWREERNGSERLRANRKNQVPDQLTVASDGRCGGPGSSFWFIPGRFRFCPCCLDQPHPAMWERSKLMGLSGEGRSSATTLLVSTALEWMNGETSGIAPEKRKLLGFTDNRQDAALQAGHFNDFLFVSLLRGATLRAVLDAGNDGISEDEFGPGLVKAPGFTAANRAARIHWMLEPDAGAVVRENAQRSLAKVLAHRVWTDLRRGWRYTNPSLAVLKLVDFQFVGLEDMADDGESLGAVLPQEVAAEREQRKEVLRIILAALLEGLAVNTEALDPAILDSVAQKSRSLLRAPWAMDHQEMLRGHNALILKPAKRTREEQMVIRAGHNSRIGRDIRKIPGMALSRDDYMPRSWRV